MRIGLDVSIRECRAAGYMVMDYPVRNFKKDPFTTDCRFTCSDPDYSREGQNVCEPIIVVDLVMNWIDLQELYHQEKEGIDKFVGSSFDDIDVPTPHNLLDLANTLHSYVGLDRVERTYRF